MNKNHKTISTIWRKEYSSRILKYSRFEISEYFKKIAALFAPGESYFYILNMHNLELDYLSSDVTGFFDLKPSEIEMSDLLKAALPKEFALLEKKEMHLVNRSTSSISFIHLKGGKSFYNLPTEKGVFQKKLGKSESDITEALTPRETEIVELLARGYKTKQIAEKLVLSRHTIRTHRRNILKKTRCKNTAELVAESMIAGLV